MHVSTPRSTWHCTIIVLQIATPRMDYSLSLFIIRKSLFKRTSRVVNGGHAWPRGLGARSAHPGNPDAAKASWCSSRSTRFKLAITRVQYMPGGLPEVVALATAGFL